MLRTLTLAILLVAALPTRADLDLETWTGLLQRAVDNGVVDYSAWQDNPDFDRLVGQIAQAETSAMNRREKLVFYINSYNILAARGILDGHSPSSLWGRFVYFKLDKYTVADEEITLFDLERERIIPLGEPRIHFAIVCASQSCPPLRNEAYTLPGLDEQLDSAARDFINDPDSNRFDAAAREALISKIFDWYEEEFEAVAGSLQKYLADYVTDDEIATMLREEAFDIDYRSYDWSLNGSL